MQPKRIALLARDAADDKKGEEIVILDLTKLSSIAHYFVITHGNSDRHVKAIGNHIIDTMDQEKIHLWHKEGIQDGKWVLLDYGSVIIHIFYHETRDFYGLERLWGEAPQLKIK